MSLVHIVSVQIGLGPKEITERGNLKSWQELNSSTLHILAHSRVLRI